MNDNVGSAMLIRAEEVGRGAEGIGMEQIPALVNLSLALRILLEARELHAPTFWSMMVKIPNKSVVTPFDVRFKATELVRLV